MHSCLFNNLNKRFSKAKPSSSPVAPVQMKGWSEFPIKFQLNFIHLFKLIYNLNFSVDKLTCKLSAWISRDQTCEGTSGR